MFIGDVRFYTWGITAGELWIELDDGNLKWDGPRLVCLLADAEILILLVDGGSKGGSGLRVDVGVTAFDFGVLSDEFASFKIPTWFVFALP